MKKEITGVKTGSKEGLIKEYKTYQDIIRQLQDEISHCKITCDEANKRSYRLIEGHEEYLGSIGRKLHDNIGQSLMVIKLMLEKTRRSRPDNISNELKDVTDQIGILTQEISDLSYDIRPSVFDNLGLVPALEGLFRNIENKFAIQVTFEHSVVSDGISAFTGITVYRFVREVLYKSITNFDLTQIIIRFRSNRKTIYLGIIERGNNMSNGIDNSTIDLSRIEERIRVMNGEINMQAISKQGLKINLKLPIK